jgi:molybdenum cofactor cytidylyltransferase
MPARADGFVAGLVLAAGGSSRLGRPKQLLPYGERTLLDHVLDTARGCRFDGADVVENRAYGEGCSSSIAAAMAALDPRCDALVLLLGDQPGVTRETVRALLAGRAGSPLAVCRYEDGRGHPFAFGREVFAELRRLHGDKGVWKLLDRAGDRVAEVAIPGTVPRDVDTWADYEAVLVAAGAP